MRASVVTLAAATILVHPARIPPEERSDLHQTAALLVSLFTETSDGPV
jgi:hypothetical protein